MNVLFFFNGYTQTWSNLTNLRNQIINLLNSTCNTTILNMAASSTTELYFIQCIFNNCLLLMLPTERRLAMSTADSTGPAGKLKAIPCPRCMTAYNWVKLQRKVITCLITWDVGNVVLLHPQISGIFSGKVNLHGLTQFPKYSHFMPDTCFQFF